MDESASGPDARPRLRKGGWGSPESRSMLRQVAQDLRRRSGFGTCVIEVLRADNQLEFVAIAGDVKAEQVLLNQATPLVSSTGAQMLGASYGSLTFVAREWLTPQVLAGIREHGWVPDIDDDDSPETWKSEDALIARLETDQGQLRAFVWFDVPESGLRPEPDRLWALSDELEPALRAVLTTIERDDLKQASLLVGIALDVIKSASQRHDRFELLAEVAEHLRRGFHLSDLRFLLAEDLAGSNDPVEPATVVDLPTELSVAVLEAGRRAWLARRVVLIEPDQVWGDDELARLHGPALSRQLADHEAGALVIVPIGVGADPLGVLLMGRPRDGERWRASESAGALEIGQDLGPVLVSALAAARERELLDRLRRLDAYRVELIETISHEMKTPLSSLMGHLELLEELEEPSGRLAASLRVMRRGGAMLSALAEDLLVLSSVDALENLEPVEQVDLSGVLADVVELGSLTAKRAGVTVQVSAPSDPVLVPGVRHELYRVLANLVSNAVKYSDPDGVVCLGLRQEPDSVEFSCADTGLGISASDQERLFGAFFRSTNPAARARPGTGLGLTIARRIVARHGGRITLESRLGQGTTFRVMLPLRAAFVASIEDV